MAAAAAAARRRRRLGGCDLGRPHRPHRSGSTPGSGTGAERALALRDGGERSVHASALGHRCAGSDTSACRSAWSSAGGTSSRSVVIGAGGAATWAANSRPGRVVRVGHAARRAARRARRPPSRCRCARRRGPRSAPAPCSTACRLRSSFRATGRPTWPCRSRSGSASRRAARRGGRDRLEHDVRGLEVAMDDPSACATLRPSAIARLIPIASSNVYRPPPWIRPRMRSGRSPVGEVHDEVRAPVGQLVDVVDADDVVGVARQRIRASSRNALGAPPRRAPSSRPAP